MYTKCFHINYIILSLSQHFYVPSVVVGTRAMSRRRKNWSVLKKVLQISTGRGGQGLGGAGTERPICCYKALSVGHLGAERKEWPTHPKVLGDVGLVQYSLESDM